MMKSFLTTSIVPALILALLLAGGALAVWGLAVGMLTSAWLAERAPSEVNEVLRITPSGQPLIEAWRRTGRDPRLYYDIDRRLVNRGEIEGQLQRGHSNSFLNAHLLAKAERYQHWLAREPFLIRGISGGMSETNWFLMKNDEFTDHAYLVGYDRRSKQCMGYVGVGGFRLDKPPREEQFVIGARSLNVASHALYSAWGRVLSYSGDRTPLYIISDDKLYAIDLQFAAAQVVASTPSSTVQTITLDRTVRLLSLDEPVLSMAFVSEAKEAASDKVDDKVDDLRILVRTSKHVLMLDSDGKLLRSTEIPPDLVDRNFWVYLPVGDEMVFQYQREHDSTQREIGLTWVNTKNSAKRSEVVALVDRELTAAQFGWLAAAIAPSPAVLAVFYYELLPAIRDPILSPADTSARRAEIWDAIWPTLLLVTVLSGVTAVYTYRRQKRYGPRTAVAWAIFVLIVGPAGLLGYLWRRRWPVAEQCASCGADAPRDRGDCVACHTDFPAPKQIGCEVFA